MSTGDVGHFDPQGRLFVDGRDDEMIVSGGENVFPREVEELLAAHDAVVEAAAIGVPDPEFGQRLRVFVVVRPGPRPGRRDRTDLRPDQPGSLQGASRRGLRRPAAAQPVGQDSRSANWPPSMPTAP